METKSFTVKCRLSKVIGNEVFYNIADHNFVRPKNRSCKRTFLMMPIIFIFKFFGDRYALVPMGKIYKKFKKNICFVCGYRQINS